MIGMDSGHGRLDAAVYVWPSVVSGLELFDFGFAPRTGLIPSCKTCTCR